jgi:outer membrane immunogenic protein
VPEFTFPLKLHHFFYFRVPPQTPFSGWCAPSDTAFWPKKFINKAESKLRWATALTVEGLNMKKLVLALTAVAAFTGSAIAADMAPAPAYTKAPVMPAPVYNWTGFYVFGGVGGGVWDAENNSQVSATGTPITVNQQAGGDGWFGTVGAGYDWQFNQSWVAGVFADGQFGSLRGSIGDGLFTGPEKLRDSWAAGARIGYLVAPMVYSYVNAGFTQSYWSGSQLGLITGGAPFLTTPSFNRSGFFIGGGVENNLNIFGITAPGWFMKTEYRAAYYSAATLPESFLASGIPDGVSDRFKPLVQTISTSLVYRFNWGGPVVAKY